MDMKDINGYFIKLSTGSITAKDENGKTCGLVRGVRRWKDAPSRVQFDFSRLLRASGLLSAGKSDNVYIDGKSLYYIASKNSEDYYEGKHGNADYWKEEAEKHYALIAQAEKAGVRVLHCYF